MAENQTEEPEELTAADLDGVKNNESEREQSPPARVEDPKAEKPETIETLREKLAEADTAVNEAKEALQATIARRNVIARAYTTERAKGSDIPLHEVNRRQRRITRVEDLKRHRASQAIQELHGHFRPGKRHYPIHPSLRQRREE